MLDSERKRDRIVAGDIGWYTLGVLQPFEAINSYVCMGVSLGLRHVLPSDQARRVVSVIRDSSSKTQASTVAVPWARKILEGMVYRNKDPIPVQKRN